MGTYTSIWGDEMDETNNLTYADFSAGYTAGYGITDSYTKTETDKKISDAVATATGGESAASVKAALESYKTDNDTRVDALEVAKHTHTNKTVLDGISESDVTAWNSKTNTKIYYSETQPTALAEGDLWFAIV